MEYRYQFHQTYGAVIEYTGSNGGVYVNWILHEQNLNSNIEEIPCVLGTAYAGSKKYWEYIKGLNGLLSFGSDEILLSLKVWFEGGYCKLLKDVTIGHIYRESAAYDINLVHYVYNKLLIKNHY